MKKYEIKVRYIGKKRCHRTFWAYAKYIGEACNRASWCIADNEEIISIREVE